MFIKEIIKQTRVEQGVTQSELAERIGCTQKDISRFESGKVSPSAEKLEQIAKALGYTWKLELIN